MISSKIIHSHIFQAFMSFCIIYLFSYNIDIYELMCDDSNLQTHFRCQHFHLTMLVHKCPNPKYDKLFFVNIC